MQPETQARDAVDRLDGTVEGLIGCSFAHGALGNLPVGDLVLAHDAMANGHGNQSCDSVERIEVGLHKGWPALNEPCPRWSGHAFRVEIGAIFKVSRSTAGLRAHVTRGSVSTTRRGTRQPFSADGPRRATQVRVEAIR
jgi:hypothetical protein